MTPNADSGALIWAVRSIYVQVEGDRIAREKLLADGWEPFAVTGGQTGGAYTFHLRRRLSPNDRSGTP